MQQNGCGALQNVALGDVPCKRAVVQAGAVEAIVVSMAMCAAEEQLKVQEYGCGALCNIATGDPFCKQAVVNAQARRAAQLPPAAHAVRRAALAVSVMAGLRCTSSSTRGVAVASNAASAAQPASPMRLSASESIDSDVLACSASHSAVQPASAIWLDPPLKSTDVSVVLARRQVAM